MKLFLMINHNLNLENWDPSVVSVDDIVSCGILLAAEALRDDQTTQLNGVTALIDCKGINMKMVRHLTPPSVYKAMNVLLVICFCVYHICSQL
jgi:hypothetical protein